MQVPSELRRLSLPTHTLDGLQPRALCLRHPERGLNDGKDVDGETTDQRAASVDTDARLLTAKLTFVGLVLLTALYAPHENSERAFRLLDWMKGSST